MYHEIGTLIVGGFLEIIIKSLFILIPLGLFKYYILK